MKVSNSLEMKALDKTAIEKIKIPGVILIENAALSVVNEILNVIKKYEYKDEIIVIAGTGNNGGDGFAVARHLKQRGIKVKLFIIGDESGIKGDAKINYEIDKNLNISILNISNQAQAKVLADSISEKNIIVDALFGTGLSRSIEGYRVDVIKAINEKSGYTISVDIPSGICSNTGKVLNVAIKAQKTVTFALPKVGLLLYPGAEYAGEVVVKDIGIPDFLEEMNNIKVNTLMDNEVEELMPKRFARSNKGTYGKIFVVAGSKNMTGAAVLLAKAAYRTGAGLINLLIPENIQNIIQHNVIEAVTIPYLIYNGNIKKSSEKIIISKMKEADAIALGSGLSQEKYAQQLVELILENAEVPIVIDADGLNIISKNLEVLKKVNIPVIITPHVGEMARLTGCSIQYVLENIMDITVQFCKKYNIICVLKDARTIISNEKGEVYINCTGNDGMATAGSGDVLTGIITALLGQGVSPFESAVLGTYLHGKTGDYTAIKTGKRGLMAGDLCNNIYKILD